MLILYFEIKFILSLEEISVNIIKVIVLTFKSINHWGNLISFNENFEPILTSNIEKYRFLGRKSI